MPYILYVHNKDRRGNPKAYGEGHRTKASAEQHRKNLRAYYKEKPRDLLGTRIVKVERRQRLTSKQIIAKYFPRRG